MMISLIGGFLGGVGGATNFLALSSRASLASLNKERVSGGAAAQLIAIADGEQPMVHQTFPGGGVGSGKPGHCCGLHSQPDGCFIKVTPPETDCITLSISSFASAPKFP